MKIKTSLYINGFILAALAGIFVGILFLRGQTVAVLSLPGNLIGDITTAVALVENNLLVLVIILIFAAAVNIFLLSRRLLRELRQLSIASTMAVGGDFKPTLSLVLSNDELGEIIKSFKAVVAQLKKVSVSAEQEQSIDKALLASIGEGVIATDRLGAIIAVNSSATEMLRCKTEDLMGKRTTDAIPMQYQNGQLVPPEKRTIQMALAENKRVTISHYFFVRKDNTKFPVVITASPVRLKGETIGGIVVFRDVTKEKEIDEAKTEFVSLASHQLRTPLTAINWYIEMLLTGDAGPLTEDQKSFLNEVYKGSKRMIQIVNEFLNVARLESGHLKITPKPIQLVDFVHDIIEEVMPIAKARNCDITFKKPSELPPLIPLDALLMRQVIHNLLTNALRYSPEGRCSVDVKIERGTTNNYIVSVKDCGIGIPKEMKSRIFEKFFRTENAIKAVTEGSGIGLYISKMIVEASNANIWFDSEENKGTTFYVSIPIKGSIKHEGNKEIIPV